MYLPGAGLSWQDPAVNTWEESHLPGPVRSCLGAETCSAGRSRLYRVLEEEHSGHWRSTCRDPEAGWGLCCQRSLEGEGAPWAEGGRGEISWGPQDSLGSCASSWAPEGAVAGPWAGEGLDWMCDICAGLRAQMITKGVSAESVLCAKDHSKP